MQQDMSSPPAAERLRRVLRHLATSPAAAAPVDSPSGSPGFPTASQRAHFERFGYCVADDAVSPELAAELRAASRRVRDRVHNGELRHGFIHRSETGEPWGIRGLLSPQHAEPSFAEYLGCPELTRYISGFTRSAELGLGSATLFTNPRDAPFTIGWHRDSSTPGGSKTYGNKDYSETAERREWEREQWADRSPGALKTPEIRGGVGFQLTLLDSEAFELVPGSHRRWRTEQEFESMSHYRGKYTDTGGGPKFGLTKFSALPEMLAVPLQAGQTMFWDGDLIHRGSMQPGIERLTLHCAMGRRSSNNTKKPQAKLAPKDGGVAAAAYSDRRLMWRTHPDVRAALPRQWQKEAWDEWAESQSVPPGVSAWHQRTCEQVDFADPEALG